MAEHSQEHLDKIMDRVRKLLARADHPNTPAPEAELARTRAEKYMVQYRIEEEALIAAGGTATDLITPVSKRIHVYPVGSHYSDVYTSLISSAMAHVGAKGVWVGVEEDPETAIRSRVLEVFGYEIDLRYMEVLFTNARIIFAGRMEPRYNPDLSDDDNVYMMRSAGMERIKIAAIMGWGQEGTGKGGAARVTAAYKRACLRRDEEPTLTGQDMNVKVYRQQYAEAFKDEFWKRLWNARNAVDAEIKEGGLVLANREGRVQEAIYQRYPELRPDETPKVRDGKPVKVRARKWTKADQRRWERQYSAAGMAGSTAGMAAAREVRIDGQTPKRRLGE